MPWIVWMALLLAAGLNAPSTALAANRCIHIGWTPAGARGIVALRPGTHVRATCPPGKSSEALTRVTVLGPGWHGTLRTPETHIDGLVGAHALYGGKLEGGGDADLPKLRARLESNRRAAMKVRALLATILIALAVFAPRRAVIGGPAAISASLLLSALGWSSLTLLGVLTVVFACLPWRALWLFFTTYLVVLAASPATQSLALLGPHPWGGGRFYGISNELETLLLAPAVVLGIAAAPLVLATVGWSRAGADGGGLLVFLASYARLAPRPRRAGAAVLAIALLFVLLDAATGGSSHVTHSVLHGHAFRDIVHRWHTSWHGVTGSWGRGIVSAICVVPLVWIATRRPRSRVVDAFLIGILVSLVANDTPQDVLFWGSITGVALRRAV